MNLPRLNPPPQDRRAVLRGASTLLAVAAAGVASGLVSGCGFALRRTPELQFRAVQLIGFKPRSPFADELRTRINASPATLVVDTAAQAQVVLEALDDVRERSVVAISAVGQVTELRLRQRFVFRLRSVSGRELIARTELVQTRDLSYTESAALAKEQEEAFLFRAMQSDIASQVLRRLASVQSF